MARSSPKKVLSQRNWKIIGMAFLMQNLCKEFFLNTLLFKIERFRLLYCSPLNEAGFLYCKTSFHINVLLVSY